MKMSPVTKHPTNPYFTTENNGSPIGFLEFFFNELLPETIHNLNQVIPFEWFERPRKFKRKNPKTFSHLQFQVDFLALWFEEGGQWSLEDQKKFVLNLNKLIQETSDEIEVRIFYDTRF